MYYKPQKKLNARIKGNQHVVIEKTKQKVYMLLKIIKKARSSIKLKSKVYKVENNTSCMSNVDDGCIKV